MLNKKNHPILTFLLIISLSVNFLNVYPVRADGETPTEPPAPTEIVTDPPVETTPMPVDSTPVPTEATQISAEATSDPIIEATATPLVEILTQAPAGTEVVVLDETGTPVPLATQEAADIIDVIDPMWCPAGVLPGGAGCTINFASINALVANMVSSTNSYTQNGTIYFTATAGGSLTLTQATLTGGDFNTLKGYNLTLQGGWNGSSVSPAFSGQTNFANNLITIGATGNGNQWVGNITLNDFTFSGADQPSVSIYTTSGTITLSNIDVLNHQNGTNTAILSSTSGNIVVQNGSTFDGNGTSSNGFTATTGSGSITISDTAFTDSAGNGNNNNNDGAILSAPTVTLTNVTATGNDGNGITINNTNLVTLNNVTASNNGTDRNPVGFQNNVGSGVFVNGNPGSSVIINGGTFNNNQRYGVEDANPANTTIYIQSNPTCTGNAAPSCYNDTVIFDNTGPVITPTISGTAGANGWYTSNVSVSWSVSDPESGILSSTGCATSNLTTDTAGATVTCSATNNARLSNSVSVTVKIDKTGPTATLAITGGTLGINGWYTSDVTVHTSGTDSMSNPVVCTADQIQSAETAGVIINGSCTNNAGLTTNAFPLSVKLDKTPPVATLTVTAGTVGTNGWYRSDVTVHTTGTDSISSPVVCTADQFQTTDTNGTAFSGTCTNNAGLNTNAVSLSIKLDKTNPIITFQIRTPANVNGWNNTDVTVNWSCTDAFSGAVSAATSQIVTSEGIGLSTTGVCTDNAGNTASDLQGGINIDKTAPTLSLPANINTEATSPSGAAVNYSATVTDNLDASVTINCSPASGSTFGLTTTTVSCSSTDAAGNTASGSFQVTVGDSTAPVIAPHLDVTVEATSSAGAVASYTSPTTSDAVDGPGTASCSPASNTTFALGDTTVDCTASDSKGNVAIPTSFVVHVVDTTAPVIAAHLDITVEATSSAGAVASYTSPTTSDAVDGPGVASCSPASNTAFALGDTVINCTATDANGNSAISTSFTVHVVDTTSPVIASHSDITITTNSAGTVVNYIVPNTSDLVDGTGVASCSPVSGSLFPIGNTQVTCTAVDSHGNGATPVTFVIHVINTNNPAPASNSSSTQASSGFVIPVTGGGLGIPTCNNIFWVDGIKITLLNLCDYQSSMTSTKVGDLPDQLPAGYSFVMGLDVDVLSKGQLVKDLPAGSGVEIDYPVNKTSKDQFVVLYWSDENGDGKGEWLKISQELTLDKIPHALISDAKDELYRINDSSLLAVPFYQIITTKKTGIFILVSK